MRTLLAIICFLATIIHGLFGYYIYFKGESLFEPEGMIVAVEKKAANGAVSYEVFKAANPEAVTEEKKQEPSESPVAVEPQSSEPKPAVAEKAGEEPQKAPEATPPAVVPEQKAEPAAVTKAEEAPWWKRMLQKKDNSQLVKQGEVTKDESGKFVPANSKDGKNEIVGFKTGWIGFLQVENAMVGLIAFILGIAVCCVKGKGKTSRWVFFWNLLFWTGLTGLLAIFEPVNTPLSMVKVGYAYPQWVLISGMTGIGAILSLLLILFSFGAQKEVQVVKKVIVEEQTKKVVPAVQPEKSAVSEKPSFLKRMFKGKNEQKAPEIRKAPVMKEPEVKSTESAKDISQKTQAKEETLKGSRFNPSKSTSASEVPPVVSASTKEPAVAASDSKNTKLKEADPVDAEVTPQKAPIQEEIVEKKESFEGKLESQKETKETVEKKEGEEVKLLSEDLEVDKDSKKEGEIEKNKEISVPKEEELPAVIVPPAPVSEEKKEEIKEPNKGNQK